MNGSHHIDDRNCEVFDLTTRQPCFAVSANHIFDMGQITPPAELEKENALNDDDVVRECGSALGQSSAFFVFNGGECRDLGE